MNAVEVVYADLFGQITDFVVNLVADIVGDIVEEARERIGAGLGVVEEVLSDLRCIDLKGN